MNYELTIGSFSHWGLLLRVLSGMFWTCSLMCIYIYIFVGYIPINGIAKPLKMVAFNYVKIIEIIQSIFQNTCTHSHSHQQCEFQSLTSHQDLVLSVFSVLTILVSEGAILVSYSHITKYIKTVSIYDLKVFLSQGVRSGSSR